MKSRLLIVDDETKTAKLLQEYFGQAGYDTETASDGREALEKIKAVKPDLILLDVMMPGMDGYTFMRELKKSDAWRAIPVIVLTAREMMRDLFVEEGVKEYVMKPFEPAELEAIVRRVLSK